MKKSILDPSFRYTPSVETNLRLTFARERRRLAKERAARERGETPQPVAAAITDITKRRKAQA